MFYIDSIDEKTVSELNKILESKLEDIPWYKGWFDSDRSSRSLEVNLSNMSTTSKIIIDLALPFFQKAGLSVSPKRGYINYVSHEYHQQTMSTSEDYYCANELEIGVHECIIILRKDERLKGGDLNIYNEDDPRDFLKLIGYEKARRLEYETVPGMVVVCNGDLVHEIQRCAGYGTINYITITLFENSRATAS